MKLVFITFTKPQQKLFAAAAPHITRSMKNSDFNLFLSLKAMIHNHKYILKIVHIIRLIVP